MENQTAFKFVTDYRESDASENSLIYSVPSEPPIELHCNPTYGSRQQLCVDDDISQAGTTYDLKGVNLKRMKQCICILSLLVVISLVTTITAVVLVVINIQKNPAYKSPSPLAQAGDPTTLFALTELKSDLNTQLNATHQDVLSLMDSTTDLEKQLQLVTEQLENLLSLRRSVEAINTTLTILLPLRSSVTDLETQVINTNGQVAGLRSSVTYLNSSVNTINGQISSLTTLRSSVSDFEMRMNTLTGQVTDLNRSVVNLGRNLGTINTTMGTINATVTGLQFKQKRQPGLHIYLIKSIYSLHLSLCTWQCMIAPYQILLHHKNPIILYSYHFIAFYSFSDQSQQDRNCKFRNYIVREVSISKQ